MTSIKATTYGGAENKFALKLWNPKPLTREGKNRAMAYNGVTVGMKMMT